MIPVLLPYTYVKALIRFIIADLLSHYQLALSHKRVAVCKYLLDMNADPFLEDRKQR